MSERNKVYERHQIGEVGVREETASLKKVVLWRPGAEAALAQLLPEDVSCFFEQFDVLGARSESDGLAKLYKEVDPNIQILQMKDMYAQMIDDKSIMPTVGVNELFIQVDKRADQFYEKYGIGDPTQVKDWVRQCVQEDIARNGEREALVMNERLLNLTDLPLANIFFMRDQSNLIGGTLVLSSMVHPIRQPEVDLVREVFDYSGIFGPNVKRVQVTGDGRFEGGDAIVTNGTAYIGVGGRSNMEGIRQIAPSILKDGLELVVVYDQRRALGLDNEMDAMHYDTKAMPLATGELVACSEELQRCRALRLHLKGTSKLKTEDLGNFVDFIRNVKRNEILEVSKAEQMRHAPNFVNLGHRKVVLSIVNENLVRQLEQHDVQVFDAKLTNITKGFGGAHCMSATIWRG